MNAPVIVMRSLCVRDEHGSINGIDLDLPAGPIGALVGTPADGSTALINSLAGMIHPHGGSVRIGGRDPNCSTELRKSVGVLLRDPALPHIGCVDNLLDFARTLRNGEAPRDTWFEPLDVAKLSSRKVASLGESEARRIALALALAVPSPTAVILYDPLGTTDVSPETLRPLLQHRVTQGACVLIISPSMADAIALADDVATLKHGKVSRPIGQPDIDQLVPGSAVDLNVSCEKPRALAIALAHDSSIVTLSLPTSHESTLLRVRTTDAVACANAIARAVLDDGLVVHAMQQVVPSTAEVCSATVGIAIATRQKAAYEATLRQASVATSATTAARADTVGKT